MSDLLQKHSCFGVNFTSIVNSKVGNAHGRCFLEIFLLKPSTPLFLEVVRCQASPFDAEKQGAERIFKFCFELVECVRALVYRESVSASVASTLLTLTHSVRAQRAHCDSTRSRCAAQARVMVYYEMRKERERERERKREREGEREKKK